MRLLIVALVTLVSSSAFGQEQQEQWMGHGVGAQGCGKYIEQRRRQNEHYDDLVGAWFYGFVSAYNYFGTGPGMGQIKGRNIEKETVLAYFDKFCREAPLASVAAGALELVEIYSK